MSKKVLVFGMTDNPGGMESCVMNYYRNIDLDKVQFDFLCNWEQMVYADEVMKNGSKIYTIPQRSKDYKAYKKAMDSFFEKHAGEYDVFWYNTCTLTNIDYLVYAKRYGIKKRIIHAHNSGNETTLLRGILHYMNKARIGIYATDFWSCSMAASKYFYSDRIIASKKHHIINNAIKAEQYKYDVQTRNEMRKELGLEEKYVIGHIGRFQYQKNHEFLIDIFAAYAKMNDKAHLLLIGQGENQGTVRQKVAALNLQDKVTFTGARLDVDKLVQAMDIFVFPSRFEGLGSVLIEAQAAGLKCITSKGKVPYEVNITGNVEFAELAENPEEWAESIRKIEEEHVERSNCLPLIVKAGYDINTEKDKLIAYLKE